MRYFLLEEEDDKAKRASRGNNESHVVSYRLWSRCIVEQQQKKDWAANRKHLERQGLEKFVQIYLRIVKGAENVEGRYEMRTEDWMAIK